MNVQFAFEIFNEYERVPVAHVVQWQMDTFDIFIMNYIWESK